ncbi:NTP transferase domain-containing protein [Frankia sp. CiP1_Cm_nod2]|uniref:NTP transferase domain-containing protein n=1 Tax=Frankia sp. CiP1_Cm_nod2 TaxID=2897161 RepID=UPI0020247CB3
MTGGRAGTGWDAVVLAGGLARRLGGADKPALTIGDQTLLERVLAAVDDARQVVVVGPRRPVAVSRHIVWTRERPPGGGPVAALAAGLGLVGAPLVAVLAADLPFVTAGALDALVRAVDDDAQGGAHGAGHAQGADHAHSAGRDGDQCDRRGGVVQGALLADPAGRRQYLTGVWRTSALRARLPVVTAGVPMRSVLAGLPARVLPADARVTLDCDRPADVERARRWARMDR